MKKLYLPITFILLSTTTHAGDLSLDIDITNKTDTKVSVSMTYTIKKSAGGLTFWAKSETNEKTANLDIDSDKTKTIEIRVPESGRVTNFGVIKSITVTDSANKSLTKTFDDPTYSTKYTITKDKSGDYVLTAK